MYEKIIDLIGKENFIKLKNSKILLVGIGGVGSFAFETLIRSGFQDITIIDHDVVEESNLNRQLVANLSTLNMNKVDVAYNIAKNINKSIQIKRFKEYLCKDNMNILDNDYDYIIDACDSLKTKLELIKFARSNKIKIISSMGVGNRIDASKIKIQRLDKTKNDPLAKKLRKLLREDNLDLKIPVVCSEELPYKKGEVNSLMTSPSIAGILMVNYIINDIINPY